MKTEETDLYSVRRHLSVPTGGAALSQESSMGCSHAPESVSGCDHDIVFGTFEIGFPALKPPLFL